MGKPRIFALFLAMLLYSSDDFDTGRSAHRAPISIAKFLKPTPHEGVSSSSLVTAPEVTESSVSVPMCNEGTHKESVDDDVGRAEEKEHAPQEEACQVVVRC
jgi:hypothetical protein